LGTRLDCLERRAIEQLSLNAADRASRRYIASTPRLQF